MSDSDSNNVEIPISQEEMMAQAAVAQKAFREKFTEVLKSSTPRDQLIIHLVQLVGALSHDIEQLQVLKLGYGIEIEEFNTRLNETEEKVNLLASKDGTSTLELFNKFLSTAPVKKRVSKKISIKKKI